MLAGLRLLLLEVMGGRVERGELDKSPRRCESYICATAYRREGLSKGLCGWGFLGRGGVRGWKCGLEM